MLLSSLLLTSIFLFLIFYELRINYLLAILGAVAIMILSPQILRFGGHYSLSYSCFIPINLYLLLLLQKGKSKKGFLFFLLALFNIIALFTHAYLGMIVVGFTFIYLILYILQNRSKKAVDYIGLFSSVILPILLFILVLKGSDLHIGRTTNAGDLLKHSVNFFTIFFSYFHPTYPFFQDLFPNTVYHWEDIAFIGFAGDLLLISVIALLIYSIFTLKLSWFKSIFFDNLFLNQALFASFILLLFSMDYPFIWDMEYLLEMKIIKVIKNFRGNGRFAWEFYFVFSVWGVYLVNKFQRYLINNNRVVFAYLLIIIYPLSLAMDGYFYHKHISSVVNVNPNLFKIDQIDVDLKQAIESIEEDRYQAIIPLPHFHTGSINYRRKSQKHIFNLSLVTSYHSSIPVMGSRLSRVSIKESKNIVQLLSNNFYEKAIIDDLSDDRPFLIIVSNESLTSNEEKLIERSNLIYKSDAFRFYEISKTSLFENSAKAEYDNYLSLAPELIEKDGFYVTDSSSYFYYNDFEDSLSARSYRGDGAFNGPMNKNVNVVTIDGNNFNVGDWYVMSAWVYNCGPNYGQDQMSGFLKLYYKEKGKNRKKIKLVGLRASQIINGCWSLIQIPFEIKEEEVDYILRLEWRGKSDTFFYMDDLLISNPENQIYKIDENGNSLFKNNHKIPLDGTAIKQDF
jgi:hypothetical protein